MSVTTPISKRHALPKNPERKKEMKGSAKAQPSKQNESEHPEPITHQEWEMLPEYEGDPRNQPDLTRYIMRILLPWIGYLSAARIWVVYDAFRGLWRKDKHMVRHWIGLLLERVAGVLRREAAEWMDGTVLNEAAGVDLKERMRKAQALYATAQVLTDHNHKVKIEQQLKDQPRLRVENRDFDADTRSILCQNGCLDLVTRQFYGHTPGKRWSRRFNVRYDPAADCPIWLDFLAGVFLGSLGLIRYVQMICGGALFGELLSEEYYFFHGDGANGKSTFLTVLTRLFGGFYGRLPADVLMGRDRGYEKTDALARLEGVRLATCNELPAAGTWSDNLLKTLASRDDIDAKGMYQSGHAFTPALTLFIAGNHLPRFKDESDGTWRRLRCIPFNAKFSNDPAAIAQGARPMVPDMDRKLLEELPGILNWCLEGAAAWWAAKGDIPPPREVLDAAREYREQNDPVGQFIDEELERCDGSAVSMEEVFARWRKFDQRLNLRNDWSQGQFSRQMRRHGWKQATVRNRRLNRNTKGYKGLALRQERSQLAALGDVEALEDELAVDAL